LAIKRERPPVNAGKGLVTLLNGQKEEKKRGLAGLKEKREGVN